jgi:hypothetical protein
MVATRPGTRSSAQVPYTFSPDVLVVRRSDGSASLLHLDGNTCVLDAAAVSELDTLLGPAGAADPAFVADLLRERLIRRPGARHAGRVRPWLALFGLGLLAARGVRGHPRAQAVVLLLLARAGIALFGWASTVRAWEDAFPQPQPQPHPQPAPGPTARLSLDDVGQAIGRGVGRSDCKARALAALALVRSNGGSARLVLGVRHFPVAAHAWVEANGTIVADDPERCGQFEAVASYSGSGAPLVL